jgi:hypothetical protein
VADSHLVKLQRLQNRVLRSTGNLPRPTRALHLAFQIPYVYDDVTKICRKQVEVIQNRDNDNVRNIGKIEAQHRKHNRLKVGGGQAVVQVSKLTLVYKIGIICCTMPGPVMYMGTL